MSQQQSLPVYEAVPLIKMRVHALNKRHSEINNTSWRKQILETNGHWKLLLMGAKG